MDVAYEELSTADLDARQNRPREEDTDSLSKAKDIENTAPRTAVMDTVNALLGWMTPFEQLVVLRKKKENKAWERFRDSLMQRWSNLNVINGLVLGAVATIAFSGLPLSKSSFTLAIISLLSSLVAIGFGVGLIYVLGDVKGSSLALVDARNPRLHLFAISIPEVWAFLSFGTFFADVGVIVWEAADKGWIVKAGVVAAALALILHFVAFGFLFREQDTTEFLIPEEDLFPSDERSPEKSRARDTSRSFSGQTDRKLSQGDRLGSGSSGRQTVPQNIFASQNPLVESPTRV